MTSSPRSAQASRTASTRVRASARYAASPRLAAWAFTLERFLDLALGLGELLARRAQPLDALLEELQRLIEVQVLGFELSDDRLEAFELLTEPGHRPLRRSRAA